MSDGGPWDPKIKLIGKSFWLKPSTLEKLELAQAAALDPDKVIARVKKAIEDEVDRLFNERPQKQAPNSHP